MSNRDSIVTAASRDRFVLTIIAVILVSAALYSARVVFEPIAFTFFAMALVWPFQKAVEARMPKPAALALTILLTLAVISIFALAIIWSIGEVSHWSLANAARFESFYTRGAQWLEAHGLFVTDLFKLLDASWLVGFVQGVGSRLRYFSVFSVIVFLLLTFALIESSHFEIKIKALDKEAVGWSVSSTCEAIARRLRQYMLIRSIASLATGLAVFAFTFSMGVELPAAWGVIAFVLNFVPYIGSLFAVILPVAFATIQFESWGMVAAIFAGLYFLQFIIGSYLEPLIAGAALAISPFAMLCAFFFWDFLWGIPGAFIGLPVTIALFTICEQTPSGRRIAKLLSNHNGQSQPS